MVSSGSGCQVVFGVSVIAPCPLVSLDGGCRDPDVGHGGHRPPWSCATPSQGVVSAAGREGGAARRRPARSLVEQGGEGRAVSRRTGDGRSPGTRMRARWRVV